ncbi:MAG TPA: hypothetical protein VFW51_07090, partial [Actinomycetota bacterium]|nr:hypothetical protein [Actinomycetota bacterium]
ALDGSTASLGGAGDDVMQGARPIVYKRFGSLATPSDENDIYKTRLRAGRRYATLLEVPRRRDFDLFVWKPGSADTWPTNYGCGKLSCFLQAMSTRGAGRSEYLEFRVRKTGVYYFHVSSFKGSGTYTLFVGVP